MTPFGDGIWLAVAPVRHLGLRLMATMTVIRLADASLLLHSPLPLTLERRAAIERLGVVAHLYAPNLYHHTWIGDWATAFPRARLHAPVGLAKKRPDLRIDRIHATDPEPAFAGVVDELHVDGFRLEESVLVIGPAHTLVVADLVHNIGRPTHAWTKFYARTMGFYDRVALSRMIRWAAFFDHAATRRSLDELLAQPFDRLILGHGTSLETGGKQALASAFTWLRT